MSFTKFLDIAQEDNESISGAVIVSGTDPGSHCFREGDRFGVSWCFPSRVSKPHMVSGVGRSPWQPCRLLSKRTWSRSGWLGQWGGGGGLGGPGGVKKVDPRECLKWDRRSRKKGEGSFTIAGWPPGTRATSSPAQFPYPLSAPGINGGLHGVPHPGCWILKAFPRRLIVAVRLGGGW